MPLSGIDNIQSIKPKQNNQASLNPSVHSQSNNNKTNFNNTSKLPTPTNKIGLNDTNSKINNFDNVSNASKLKSQNNNETVNPTKIVSNNDIKSSQLGNAHINQPTIKPIHQPQVSPGSDLTTSKHAQNSEVKPILDAPSVHINLDNIIDSDVFGKANSFKQEENTGNNKIQANLNMNDVDLIAEDEFEI